MASPPPTGSWPSRSSPWRLASASPTYTHPGGSNWPPSWDGWDWAKNVYGGDGATTDPTFWSPNEASGGPDTGTATPNIGGLGGDGIGVNIEGCGNNEVESGAWGCQFNLTAADYAYITTGYGMYLEFDYYINDAQPAGTGEPVWIKARIGSSNATMWHLGRSLDGGGFTIPGYTPFSDPTPEIWHYHEDVLTMEGGYAPVWGSANLDLTANITGAGTYYLDFGVKFETRDQNYALEGVECIFYNVALTAQVVWSLSQDVVIVGGGVNESFGHSVSGIANFDEDQFADWIIGAPYANNTNGINSGATYILALTPSRMEYLRVPGFRSRTSLILPSKLHLSP